MIKKCCCAVCMHKNLMAVRIIAVLLYGAAWLPLNDMSRTLEYGQEEIKERKLRLRKV